MLVIAAVGVYIACCVETQHRAAPQETLLSIRHSSLLSSGQTTKAHLGLREYQRMRSAQQKMILCNTACNTGNDDASGHYSFSLPFYGERRPILNAAAVMILRDSMRMSNHKQYA